MKTAESPLPNPREAQWRAMLTTETRIGLKRRLHNRIPSSPRCKMCLAPFAGIGGVIMPLMGRRRWAKNPKYCAGCFSMLRANHGGAEIECSLLFADVRGSTTLAERMSPMAFTRLMGRFYDAATSVLVNQGAIVDKFVGDEVIGIFIPAMATQSHAQRAIEAARTLLIETGHGRPKGPWIPVGIGVNTGVAYVGSIGDGMDTEMTAMGDVVNTTARLSSVAAAGEILVTAGAAAAAGLEEVRLEHRSLTLKGKASPTDVVVLAVTAGG
jgi:adenylate cyclase